jgi:hypothetical protein
MFKGLPIAERKVQLARIQTWGEAVKDLKQTLEQATDAWDDANK